METPTGEQICCRVYQQVINPSENVPLSDLPVDRQPSNTYHRTIVKGAKECLLPNEYLEFLRNIVDNGKQAVDDFSESLNL